MTSVPVSMTAGFNYCDGALFLSDVKTVLRLGALIIGSDITVKYFRVYGRSMWI